jgi:hypothetical protein
VSTYFRAECATLFVGCYNDFVDLVGEIHGNRNRLRVAILVQPMSLKGPKEYEELLAREHHTLIDRDALREAFAAMRDRAAARKIPVTVFYSIPIDEFVAKGCPLPDYDFVSRDRGKKPAGVS